MPVDRGNDRLAQVPDPHQCIEVKANEATPVGFVLRSVGCELPRVEIKSGRKRLSPSSRKYDYANSFVSVNHIKCITKLSQKSLRQRIMLLWAVQGYRYNPIIFLNYYVLVRHRVPFFI